MSVRPACLTNSSMWCASQYEAGRSQPRMRHPPSRIASATRCFGGRGELRGRGRAGCRRRRRLRCVFRRRSMGGEQPTRHGRVGVFEESDGRAAPERVRVRGGGRDDADAGLAGSEDGLGVGESAGPEHVEDEVVCQLFIRARIVHQLVGTRLLGRIDEPGSSATGTQGGRDDGVDPGASLIIESEAAAPGAVPVEPGAECAALEPLLESPLGTGRVEQIPDGAGGGSPALPRCARAASSTSWPAADSHAATISAPDRRPSRHQSKTRLLHRRQPSAAHRDRGRSHRAARR